MKYPNLTRIRKGKYLKLNFQRPELKECWNIYILRDVFLLLYYVLARELIVADLGELEKNLHECMFYDLIYALCFFCFLSSVFPFESWDSPYQVFSRLRLGSWFRGIRVYRENSAGAVSVLAFFQCTTQWTGKDELSNVGRLWSACSPC